MNRSIPFVAIATAFVIGACGSSASAARTSPSPGTGSAFRNGASGQLVQITGQTLILTGPNGDITVTFTSATTFNKTSLATLADITSGTCITANGRKDSAGAITATNVRISPRTAAGCAARAFAPTPAPGASPRPGATPRPSGQPNVAFVTGEVTAVSGTAVTVLSQTGGTQTITVATAATITTAAAVSASSLQDGQCVRANGPRDSAGSVQATSITITPAGPSGSCTAGIGGGRRSGAPPGSAGTG
jgi:Domain of unknown function (DUF5666)